MSAPRLLPRILYVCHNHPDFHPGGTEIFAHDLFRTVKRKGAEAMFLACTDTVHRAEKPGTRLQGIGRTADEVVLWTGHFDRFYQSQVDLHGIVPELTELLETFQPDIVHFHHTLMIGVEALFLVKRVLPRAKIVLTLHDYFPICANDGQMVTTNGHVLCRGASADACRRCFPQRALDAFVLREQHVKTMFGLVDRFVAPSRFLRDRYVAWGLPAAKIEVVANGRPSVKPAPQRKLAKGARRDVFGYFGNLSPYKGVKVALAAAKRLAADGAAFTLRVHGGAPFQSEEFRAAIAGQADDAAGRVAMLGPYHREDVARLMRDVDWVVVPSIWWENAPLVIQEAFQHRRPVICSDIGGMAEMVRDGADGLHFRVADPASLAATMRRAADDPREWERLVAGMAPARTIEESADDHLALYRNVQRGRSGGRGESRRPAARRAAPIHGGQIAPAS
ncbi:MAG: glycosyltransferase family 4 protein [Alphaproteobacteria bacterium]|nr:glycosyltransferase family 4 protein [Alphaproteobacteria bacterium]